jgi:hypothetical protein
MQGLLPKKALVTTAKVGFGAGCTAGAKELCAASWSSAIRIVGPFVENSIL